MSNTNKTEIGLNLWRIPNVRGNACRENKTALGSNGQAVAISRTLSLLP